MFDIFNRRKVRELTDRLESYSNDLDTMAIDNANLRQLLREQDELIWQMSQLSSWTEQRPFFNRLLTATNYRKEAESRRIGNIITKELKQGTYL